MASIAQTQHKVKRLLIGSYESTWGLPEGAHVTYHCAWDCDSGQRLYDTESVYPDETARLVGERYPGAVVVAESAPVEKGARL